MAVRCGRSDEAQTQTPPAWAHEQTLRCGMRPSDPETTARMLTMGLRNDGPGEHKKRASYAESDYTNKPREHTPKRNRHNNADKPAPNTIKIP